MRTAVFAALLATACASSNRERLGDVNFQPYSQIAGFPTTFSVQTGRILSPAVDVTADADNCVRGTVQGSPLQLCQRPGSAPPMEQGDVTQRWTGPSGDFTLEMQRGGKQMRMDGYIVAGPRGQDVPMQATIELGQGPQWDELRRHPALLAIAAATAGVRGEPVNQ